MHAFIIGSTFVITYMMVNSCLRKCFRREKYIMGENINMENIYEMYPYTQYIYRSSILQFFAEDKNFERLKKILDLNNGILDKTIRLVENNEEINNIYLETLNFYGNKNFHYTYSISSIFEIRGEKFQTSLGQLNYFRWLIENDYFLHIE